MAESLAPRLYSHHTARRLALYFPTIAFVLVMAMLLAVQTRLELAITSSLDPDLLQRFEFDTVVPNGVGWHEPADGGAWMGVVETTFAVPLAPDWYAVEFRAQGITAAVLRTLRFSVNDVPLRLIETPEQPGWSVFGTTIPEEVIARSPEAVRFEFDVRRTVIPAEAGLGPDTRPLGVFVDWFEIAPTVPPLVQPTSMFLMLLGTALVGTVAAVAIRAARPRLSVKRVLFTVTVICAPLAVVMLNFLPVDFPVLQLNLFMVFAVLLAALVLLVTPTPVVYGKRTTLADHLMLLWKNRFLLGLWTRFNIASRYSQAFLGIFWIIIQPLTTSLTLAFVFSQILRSVDTRGVPYTAFFLTALVFWNYFNQGVMLSAVSMVAAGGILDKVYFPREIIVLVKLGEAIVDMVFTFAAMLVINAFLGIFPSAAYIYLPIIFLIQTALMLGFMLFLSYLSVMVRDVPQLVQIVLRFLFYLTPILYPGSAIPEDFRFIALLNPLTPLTDAYREVILYNAAPTPATLYYPAVLALVLLYMGYLFFKQNEKRMTDYI
ncbi:MAG: hypothetical protein OHK0046_49690 [Anaerolineae bacterium]